jgi:hypothetical protein
MPGWPAGLGMAAALVLALAACVPPAPPPGPPPPVQTTTSLDLVAARQALEERLQAEGFDVDRAVGGLVATTTDARFVACEPMMMQERGSSATRSHIARPDRVTATASIRIEEAGPRTRLSWGTAFSGSYLNRFDNRRVEAPCRSTGELERLLETALPS